MRLSRRTSVVFFLLGATAVACGPDASSDGDVGRASQPLEAKQALGERAPSRVEEEDFAVDFTDSSSIALLHPYDSQAARIEDTVPELFPETSAEGRTVSKDGKLVEVTAEEIAPEDHGKVWVDPPSWKCSGDYWSVGNDMYFKDWPGSPHFRAPRTAFGGDKSCTDCIERKQTEAFLRSVRPRFPMYLPFRNSKVRLGHGWFYDNGKGHLALDYSRIDVPVGTDPTFAVRAVAPGIVRRVVAATSGGGNIVIVEHAPAQTGASGPSFFSIYMHLRNGHTSDVAKALALPPSDGCNKYIAFATKYPDHVSWGTDAQTIMVKEGDVLEAGQQIAWAGNTGCGGASAGLNDDGSPMSPNGNVHLHLNVAVEHPSFTVTNADGTISKVAVTVDPYGIYDRAIDTCYDADTTPKMKRLFQPFAPTFVNLKATVLQAHLSHYPDLGMELATLSSQLVGDDVQVSGSFQPKLSSARRPIVWAYRSQMEDAISDYESKGLVPRDISIAFDKWGEPRYSAIFDKRVAGESHPTLFEQADVAFPVIMNTFTNGVPAMRLESYQRYRQGDIIGPSVAGDYFLASFTSDFGPGSKVYTGEPQKILDLLQNEHLLGFEPDRLTIADTWDHLASVTLRPANDCRVARVDLTATGFAVFFHDYVTVRGYRLHHVQGYDGSTRFTAIMQRAKPANGICP